MGQNDAPPTIGSLDTPKNSNLCSRGTFILTPTNSPVDPCDSHFSSMGLGGWISAWPKAAGNHQLKQRRNTGKICNKKSGPRLPGFRFSSTKVPYKNLISRTYVSPADEAGKFVESQLHPHKSCPKVVLMQQNSLCGALKLATLGTSSLLVGHLPS